MHASRNHLASDLDTLCQADPVLEQLLKAFEDADHDYQVCVELEAALNTLGYAIDWGLDAEPFHLRRLEKT